MSDLLKTELCIIGGGAGGLSLASGAVQLGLKVVLIEGSKMGGDCLNQGCVPSKSLLSAAKIAWKIKQAKHLGIDATHVNIHFSEVMQHVHQVIDKLSVHDSVDRFERLGVNVIQANAQFINKHTVKAGEKTIQAKHFVIATGSSPFVPPIPGLDQVPYLTNETVFSLTEQPKHLIVIGGGPIGCELAQAFALLGSEVTVLEGFKILPKDEADCVEIVKEQLENTPIALHEGIKIEKISHEKDRITVLAEQNGKKITFTGSELLIATGRRPNVKDLNLESAGVEYSSKGINVNKRLRTTNKKIYAIGDAAGSFQFTHIANYHAGIVLKNILFKLPVTVDYSAIPWVTYTEPELAHVGLLSEEAKSKKLSVEIMELAFSENDRAQTEQATIGKIKVITDKKGRILGVTIVGEKAGDWLLPWIMAIREKKTLRSFTDTIVPYPTFAEASKQVAGKFYTPKLFSKKVRFLVRILQKLC